MEHDLELVSPRLEILEIEVFNVIYNPGNIGNWIFLIFSYPGNIGNWIFLIAWYPGNTGGGRAAPGVVLCCLGLFLEHVSWNFRISWKYWKYVCLDFGIFPKKTRAEISRRMHRRMSRDLSYETDSGPKTKTVSDPNFQVTATAAAATTSQQLSHLARALDHHAQGPNIPFGVNPSLRYHIDI